MLEIHNTIVVMRMGSQRSVRNSMGQYLRFKPETERQSSVQFIICYCGSQNEAIEKVKLHPNLGNFNVERKLSVRVRGARMIKKCFDLSVEVGTCWQS